MNETIRGSNFVQNNSTNISDLVLSWKISQLTAECLRNEENSFQCSPALEFTSEEEYKKFFRQLIQHDLKSSIVAALENCRKHWERKSTVRDNLRKEAKCFSLENGATNVLLFLEKESVVNINEGDILVVFSGDVFSWQTLCESSLFLVDRVFNQRPEGSLLIRIRLPEYQISSINFSLPPLNGNNFSETRQRSREQGEISEVYIKVIGSVVTASREFLAVENLSKYALKLEILKPSQCEGLRFSIGCLKGPNPKFQRIMAVVDKVSSSWQLNASQYEAVASCVTSSTGFHLIQGPPGTGKTNTLLAILNVLHVYGYQLYYDSLIENWYQRNGHQTSSLDTDSVSSSTLLSGLLGSLDQTLGSLSRSIRKPRVMICAPSNAAVDEAMSKLLQHSFVDVDGNQYQPEMIRMGANERVSEATKALTAERQALVFYNQFCSSSCNHEQYCVDEDLKKKWLVQWNEEYRNCRMRFEKCSSKEKKMENYERLEQLQRDLNRLTLVFSKERSKDQIISELTLSYVKTAQIVFCTLSGAFLLFSLSGNSAISHTRNQMDKYFWFDTVIIDEAAQATEPACLIPFLFQIKRCVLIGDPQQLPATVFSCGDLGTAYGQSLLERFCRVGRPVIMLDTQYRMHPAISLFPNQYFYQGLLKNDTSVCNDNRSHICHSDFLKPLLGPYAVIDISDGKEFRSSSSGSFYNEKEADIIARIYKYFQHKYLPKETSETNTPFKKRVGIVTPYRRQLLSLRQAFEKHHISLRGVEIDSVDAFQGREKDWIILSCVRCSFEKGIGFVRDIRRMNVAITRAKYSLLIVGNMKALSHHSTDWFALVENAKQRGVLLNGTAIIENLDTQRAVSIKERKRPLYKSRFSQAVKYEKHS
ncbi:Helicase SEN1 [Galdieria sulphuraria]|nr:Helicase SEN1 [Galdieria sulphuraria]